MNNVVSLDQYKHQQDLTKQALQEQASRLLLLMILSLKPNEYLNHWLRKRYLEKQNTVQMLSQTDDELDRLAICLIALQDVPGWQRFQDFQGVDERLIVSQVFKRLAQQKQQILKIN